MVGLGGVLGGGEHGPSAPAGTTAVRILGDVKGVAILPTSHVTAKRRLRELIADRAGHACAQLPSEADLAGLLGVSRATLRTALLSLQKEGLVRRRQGRGTFVQRRAAALQANLAQDRPFLDVIRDLGHVAETRARVVGVRDGQLSIERIFTADGRPAVVAHDRVPAAALRVPWEHVTPEDSIFAFCAAWCGRRIAYSVAEIVPVAADERVAAELGLVAGSPAILLHHQHLAEGDVPLASTRAYLNDGLLRFAVVRGGDES